MNSKLKVLTIRFLRGCVAGAIATMMTVAIPNYQSWNDIQIWLTSLLMAGIVGGISGGILALDKALRWEKRKKSK